jgi:hypothetical protein
MNDYQTLQKLAYGLIAIMLIFNFLGSTVVYEQEIDDDSGGATFTYYLDEVELKDEYAEDSFSYSTIGFSEMEDFMTNLGYLTLLALLASVFFAWKIKEVIDGSDDLEIVQKAGYAVSVLAILSALYPVYGIPNALEDDWKEGPFDEGDGFDYDGGFIGEEKFDDPEWGEMVFDSGPGMGWYLLVLSGILGIAIIERVKDIDN